MIFFILGCMVFQLQAQEITPTERHNQSLSFADDLDYEDMDLAIERQLKAYQRTGLRGEIKFGDTLYPRTVLRDSLVLLQSIFSDARACLKINPEKICLDKVNIQINKNFAIYRPIPAKGEDGYAKKKTKFTSYYSPDLHGSRVRTERFSRAIYRTPDTAEERNFTRVQIDYQGALAGKGYEIFWVEESFYDLYLLHVQGGGRIKIHAADGTIETKYLSYSGRNTHSFRMIYHYMLAQGYIQNGSIINQRRFLAANPDKEEEIFANSPSYIFFKESAEEPVGVQNIPLTEGRSVAIDTRIYKSTGLINFVRTVRASHTQGNRVIKVPFSRFFIAQDTGGSIRGNARCDLYFGYGPQAEMTAYNMNELGEQYFLIKQ
jgi:membrane-bound lytic murein transglycosylase A